MDIFIKVIQLLLSLSILVIFHEFGHFIAAKIFKTRVEKFYLFFNPYFSLFKFKKGETEYGIGWLPLGGYVKISGMIDESMDREQMKQPPQPWEFRSKPAWQRLIIMLGGVTVNIILAAVIYMVMLSMWGDRYLPTSEAKYGIVTDSLGNHMGLINGDKILTVDQQYIDDLMLIPQKIVLNNAKTIQVIRDGKFVNVEIPRTFMSRLMKENTPVMLAPRIPFEIANFSPGSAAKKGGLQLGDRIIGLNDSLVPFFDEFRSLVKNYKDKDVSVVVIRNQDTIKAPVHVNSRGLIGVETAGDLSKFFKLKEKSYNIITAIPAGFSRAFSKAGDYLKSMKLLFTQEKAYESVGGFITIGNIFPSTWNWEAFWSLTAFLSIMLAILNVLPIPALDGGHVMFLLYEIVFRRKPSEKFMEYAQIVGMVLLFGLLIFANLNDILKLFR